MVVNIRVFGLQSYGSLQSGTYQYFIKNTVSVVRVIKRVGFYNPDDKEIKG